MVFELEMRDVHLQSSRRQQLRQGWSKMVGMYHFGGESGNVGEVKYRVGWLARSLRIYWK